MYGQFVPRNSADLGEFAAAPFGAPPRGAARNPIDQEVAP